MVPIVQVIVQILGSRNSSERVLLQSARLVWALAPSARMRRALVEAGVVDELLRLLSRLMLPVDPSSHSNPVVDTTQTEKSAGALQ